MLSAAEIATVARSMQFDDLAGLLEAGGELADALVAEINDAVNESDVEAEEAITAEVVDDTLPRRGTVVHYKDGGRRRYVVTNTVYRPHQGYTLVALSGSTGGSVPSGVQANLIERDDDQDGTFTGALADKLRAKYATYQQMDNALERQYAADAPLRRAITRPPDVSPESPDSPVPLTRTALESLPLGTIVREIGDAAPPVYYIRDRRSGGDPVYVRIWRDADRQLSSAPGVPPERLTIMQNGGKGVIIAASPVLYDDGAVNWRATLTAAEGSPADPHGVFSGTLPDEHVEVAPVEVTQTALVCATCVYAHNDPHVATHIEAMAIGDVLVAGIVGNDKPPLTMVRGEHALQNMNYATGDLDSTLRTVAQVVDALRRTGYIMQILPGSRAMTTDRDARVRWLWNVFVPATYAEPWNNWGQAERGVADSPNVIASYQMSAEPLVQPPTLMGALAWVFKNRQITDWDVWNPADLSKLLAENTKVAAEKKHRKTMLDALEAWRDKLRSRMGVGRPESDLLRATDGRFRLWENSPADSVIVEFLDKPDPWVVYGERALPSLLGRPRHNWVAAAAVRAFERWQARADIADAIWGKESPAQTRNAVTHQKRTGFFGKVRAFLAANSTMDPALLYEDPFSDASRPLDTILGEALTGALVSYLQGRGGDLAPALAPVTQPAFVNPAASTQLRLSSALDALPMGSAVQNTASARAYYKIANNDWRILRQNGFDDDASYTSSDVFATLPAPPVFNAVLRSATGVPSQEAAAVRASELPVVPWSQEKGVRNYVRVETGILPITVVRLAISLGAVLVPMENAPKLSREVRVWRIDVPIEVHAGVGSGNAKYQRTIPFRVAEKEAAAGITLRVTFAKPDGSISALVRDLGALSMQTDPWTSRIIIESGTTNLKGDTKVMLRGTDKTWTRKDAIEREDNTNKNLGNGVRVRSRGTPASSGYRYRPAFEGYKDITGLTLPKDVTGVIVSSSAGQEIRAKRLTGTSAAYEIQWDDVDRIDIVEPIVAANDTDVRLTIDALRAYAPAADVPAVVADVPAVGGAEARGHGGHNPQLLVDAPVGTVVSIRGPDNIDRTFTKRERADGPDHNVWYNTETGFVASNDLGDYTVVRTAVPKDEWSARNVEFRAEIAARKQLEAILEHTLAIPIEAAGRTSVRLQIDGDRWASIAPVSQEGSPEGWAIRIGAKDFAGLNDELHVEATEAGLIAFLQRKRVGQRGALTTAEIRALPVRTVVREMTLSPGAVEAGSRDESRRYFGKVGADDWRIIVNSGGLTSMTLSDTMMHDRGVQHVYTAPDAHMGWPTIIREARADRTAETPASSVPKRGYTVEGTLEYGNVEVKRATALFGDRWLISYTGERVAKVGEDGVYTYVSGLAGAVMRVFREATTLIEARTKLLVRGARLRFRERSTHPITLAGVQTYTNVDFPAGKGTLAGLVSIGGEGVRLVATRDGIPDVTFSYAVADVLGPVESPSQTPESTSAADTAAVWAEAQAQIANQEAYKRSFPVLSVSRDDPSYWKKITAYSQHGQFYDTPHVADITQPHGHLVAVHLFENGKLARAHRQDSGGAHDLLIFHVDWQAFAGNPHWKWIATPKAQQIKSALENHAIMDTQNAKEAAAQRAKMDAEIDAMTAAKALDTQVLAAPTATTDTGETGDCRTVTFPFQGVEIRVVCDRKGEKTAWHNLYVGGKRFGWSPEEQRWSFKKAPAPDVLAAVRAQGISAFPLE